LMASVALAVLDAETVRGATRATQSICRRRGFCAPTGVEMFAVGHVMRLARDTHLAALSERDERTAGAHPDCGPCVRDSQRTVAHARVIHQGRLFARRTATRMSMDDARPGRAVDVLGVTRVTAAVTFHDRRRSWDLSCPSQVCSRASGERRFRSLQTPRARWPRPFISRPFSSGDRWCQVTCWTRRSRDGVVALWGIRLMLLTCGPMPGVEICSTPAAILPWALRMSGTVRGREM
jgi:hypothetical protein